MFEKKKNQAIYCTRGDSGSFPVSWLVDGEAYKFQPDDWLRFKVYCKNNCASVVIQKDTKVLSETEEVIISLSGAQTKIGNLINKPVDYWYEVELNPETSPRTIIGYDDEGPKVFRLFPEGKDITEAEEGELPEGTLDDLVAEALERAKASGMFDGEDGVDGKDGAAGKDGKDGAAGKDGEDGEPGEDGYTPQRGTDYWTEADKAEIKAYVDNAIIGGSW